jgi:predicted CXXCH cytochrome family protein
VRHQLKLEIATLITLLACGLPATALAAEHPVKLEKDADCATCHEDKTKGKAVHSAIAMGCTTCHDVKTEGETTSVALTSPKEQLCFTCHEKQAKEGDTLHGPYEKGQCVTCHDPHTSDFPKQLRAEGNGLCLECHAERAKVEDNVSLFGGKAAMTKAEFEPAPKIVSNPAAKIGHPFARHPIAEIQDPLRGEKMSCLSCHQPHTSPQQALMAVPKDPKGDICDACHQSFEAKVHDENLKKYGAVEEQNRKELMDKQRHLNMEHPVTPSAPPPKTGSN